MQYGRIKLLKCKEGLLFVLMFYAMALVLAGCKTQSLVYKNIRIEKNKIVILGPDEDDKTSEIFDYVIFLAIDRGMDSIFIERGNYFINRPITVSNKMVIFGDLRDEVVVQQLTWGYPVFDVLNADEVTISNMTLVSQQPRTYPNGFVSRGTDGFVNNSGIYSNSSKGIFEHLDIEGFTCGIFLSSWDGKGLYEQKIGNRITDIKVSRVDFGVLVTGQKNLWVDEIHGSYMQQKGSGAAPHLIYISDSTDPAYAWNENITIEHCYAENSPIGIAFQIGSVREGHLSGLYAKGCNGLIAMERVQNVTMDTLVALDDISPEAGSFFVKPKGVEHLFCTHIRIESLNPKARLMRLDGVYNRFEDIVLQTASTSINDIGIITMEGSDNVLAHVSISCRNADAGGLGVRLQGLRQQLENLECSSCAIGFSIMEDCQDCSVRLESHKVVFPDQKMLPAPNYNYSKTSSVTLLDKN